VPAGCQQTRRQRKSCVCKLLPRQIDLFLLKMMMRVLVVLSGTSFLLTVKSGNLGNQQMNFRL